MWIVHSDSGFTYERYVIPDFPNGYASFREVLTYYSNQLAAQGMILKIRVVNFETYDEARFVSGLGGNGYVFLQGASDVFHAKFNYRPGHVLVVSGARTNEMNKVRGSVRGSGR
jgi:hypothetical protein